MLKRTMRERATGRQGLLFLCGALVVASIPMLAVPSTAATDVTAAPAEAHKAVAEFANLLEENFVFPELGVRYAALLRRNLETGRYQGLDAYALAKTVTADLQALAPEGHLRLSPPPGPANGARRVTRVVEEPIESARWIADGVAYIKFNVTPNEPEVVSAVDRFMAEHASARTLIIDARTHRGGGVGPIDAMLPYLFPKPARVAVMDTRSAPERSGQSPIRDSATLRRVASDTDHVRREHHVTPHASEKRLFDAKVFYLTSSRTASAAEHMALVLKRTRRATLIGEKTYGAGHFGMLPALSGGFTGFVPIGRTYDPDTGEGWEGKGITPDVDVPADQALEKALELAQAPAPDAAAKVTSKAHR